MIIGDSPRQPPFVNLGQSIIVVNCNPSGIGNLLIFRRTISLVVPTRFAAQAVSAECSIL